VGKEYFVDVSGILAGTGSDFRRITDEELRRLCTHLKKLPTSKRSASAIAITFRTSLPCGEDVAIVLEGGLDRCVVGFVGRGYDYAVELFLIEHLDVVGVGVGYGERLGGRCAACRRPGWPGLPLGRRTV